jgi:hypothetical protein
LKININGQEYPFDADSLTFDEACDLEGVFGGTFGEFGAALRKTSMTAIRAFVFILMRRNNPELRIDDIGRTVLGDLKFVKEKADKDETEPVRELPDPTLTDFEQPEPASED